MGNLKWLRIEKFLMMMFAVNLCLYTWGAFNAKAAEKDSFPNKTIRVIVPAGAGAGLDMEPRGLAPYIKKYIGVDVVIENVPGAGARIGLTKAWKADPDGYTLIYHGIPMSILNEFLGKTEFRTVEFTHLFSLCLTNMVLVVHPDNWKTFEEFLKVAQSKPVSGGIPGFGNTSHFCGLVSIKKLGIKINWVPFEGSAEILPSLAGKHLDFAILSTNSAMPMIAAGRLRPLLVYSQGPDPVFPDVPFPSKLGYDMTILSAIRGFSGPPKLPANRAKILEDAMFKAATDPAYADWAKKRKLEIAPMGGNKFLAEVRNQYAVVEEYKESFKSP